MTLQYDLRHERHAIGEFSASMQFKTGLLEDQFAPVQAKLKTLAEKFDLPAPAPLNMFRFGTPPGVPLPAGPVSYQRFAKDGSVEAAVLCDDNTVTFTLKNYTRWNDIASTVRDIFVELAEVYLPTAVAISLVRLQYLNEFRAKDDGPTSASELFKPKSKWIAPFAEASDEFWHCHIGSFIPDNADMRHLINVNCNVLSAAFPPDNLERTYAKVLVLVGCYYDVGKPLNDTGDKLSEKLETDLRLAHALERRTLAEVVSDPYLEIMGALNDDF